MFAEDRGDVAGKERNGNSFWTTLGVVVAVVEEGEVRSLAAVFISVRGVPQWTGVRLKTEQQKRETGSSNGGG